MFTSPTKKRSKRINRKFCPSLKPLPSNFAKLVLNFEMEVEISKSLPALQQLLDLYIVLYIQRAIEYYEGLNDSRYKYYSVRMNSLLGRQELLNPSSLNSRRRSLSVECSCGNSLEVTSFAILQKAEALLRNHENINHSTSRQLQINIAGQSAKLNSKVCDRKAQMLRSATPTTHGKERESDRSAGIIEKYMVEKIETLDQIKKKYESEKEKVTETGKFYVGMIEEIDRNMQREVKQAQIGIEMNRKNEFKKRHGAEP